MREWKAKIESHVLKTVSYTSECQQKVRQEVVVRCESGLLKWAVFIKQVLLHNVDQSSHYESLRSTTQNVVNRQNLPKFAVNRKTVKRKSQLRTFLMWMVNSMVKHI